MVIHPTGELLALVWPRVSGLIQLALDEGWGEMNLGDVWEHLQSGNMQMLVALDEEKILAALVTQVVDYTRRRALRVVFAGGEGLDQWVGEVDEMLVKGAKAIGANGIEICGRAGWARALRGLDYRPKYTTVVKEIYNG
jgi:hypothetical protein